MDFNCCGLTYLYNVYCVLVFIYRVEADQEALWKYSLDLLKDYVTEETLHGLEAPAY